MSPFNPFRVAPAAVIRYGTFDGFCGFVAVGTAGRGYDIADGNFGRDSLPRASPLAPPTGSRTVTFGHDTAGSDTTIIDTVLRQILDCITALEGRPSRPESASGDVSGVRPSSLTPSEDSQTSTPSNTSNNTSWLDHALGVPDDELKHVSDKHLSKK